MTSTSLTARARLVSTLTQEILNNPEEKAYAIASEHQFCRRFGVSRVTVRLALSDLENRGLIYRRHGKGTFAHGKSMRVHRQIGIMLKSQHAAEHRPMSEIIRGVQSVQAGLRAAVVLINTSPEEWRPEMASCLNGVVVLPQDVTSADIDVLRTRKLPYLMVGESDLPGPHIDLGQREAARAMTEKLLKLGHRHFALLTSFNDCLDAAKRGGVHEALTSAGIDLGQVPEFPAQGDEGAIADAVEQLLNLRPRPTAVIAFDDNLGCMLSLHARRQHSLQVPGDLSIVSFHDWPYLRCVEPVLTTVKFDFFAAGKKAAETLNGAAQTGEEIADLSFAPIYREGQTCAPAKEQMDV